jgi:hypothetical protein
MAGICCFVHLASVRLEGWGVEGNGLLLLGRQKDQIVTPGFSASSTLCITRHPCVCLYEMVVVFCRHSSACLYWVLTVPFFLFRCALSSWMRATVPSSATSRAPCARWGFWFLLLSSIDVGLRYGWMSHTWHIVVCGGFGMAVT